MANSYSQVYIQAVFAVKYRAAIIQEDWQNDLFAVIGTLINETGCTVIIVNGVADHVHCFFRLKSTVALSTLMQSVKAKSSKWVNEQALTDDRFEWQDGYSVFSYSQSHTDKVHAYVKNQAAHHRTQTFRDEYTTLLDKFKVPYEEQYIFEALI